MQGRPATEFKNEFNQLEQEQEGHGTRRGKNYGNGIILCRDSRGQPTAMLGPHWYIFVFAFLITITLIVMLLYSMSSQLSPFWFYSLIVTSCIYAYSYLKIGLSYPGFADPPSTQPSAATPMCETCGVVKSYGVYHCSDCNVCIEGYDHHCPWIGKCVGARNLCSFYFFLVMIFGTLVFCFVATLASASYREGKGAPGKTGHLVVAG